MKGDRYRARAAPQYTAGNILPFLRVFGSYWHIGAIKLSFWSSARFRLIRAFFYDLYLVMLTVLLCQMYSNLCLLFYISSFCPFMTGLVMSMLFLSAPAI